MFRNRENNGGGGFGGGRTDGGSMKQGSLQELTTQQFWVVEQFNEFRFAREPL